MLKDNGKIKPKKIIRCPYCKKRMTYDVLEEEGNIEKVGNVTIVTCNGCFEEFNL